MGISSYLHSSTRLASHARLESMRRNFNIAFAEVGSDYYFEHYDHVSQFPVLNYHPAPRRIHTFRLGSFME